MIGAAIDRNHGKDGTFFSTKASSAFLHDFRTCSLPHVCNALANKECLKMTKNIRMLYHENSMGNQTTVARRDAASDQRLSPLISGRFRIICMKRANAAERCRSFGFLSSKAFVDQVYRAGKSPFRIAEHARRFGHDFGIKATT